MKATAKVIAHSTSEAGVDLISLQLRYWRPIHSQLKTHRVFSTSSGSSRARPVRSIIENVRREPWGPLFWGREQSGMVAREKLSEAEEEAAKALWLKAANRAADCAEEFVELGVHKQLVNRLLEPFTYIDTILTGTSFDNFFGLRIEHTAQPEMQQLAKVMKEAIDNSRPTLLKEGEWHLPYINTADKLLVEDYIRKNDIEHLEYEILIKMSAARCARVSYKLFDDTNPTIEKDLELFNKLANAVPMHASPMEHQATPDVKTDGEWNFPELHGNFHGWLQHRKIIEELG